MPIGQPNIENPLLVSSQACIPDDSRCYQEIKGVQSNKTHKQCSNDGTTPMNFYVKFKSVALLLYRT